MSATQYTYSISSNFPNQKLSTDRLMLEIRTSPITVALDYISTLGDECDIWFKAELSVEEVDTLNSLVAAHSGEELPNKPLPVNEDGIPLTTIEPRVGTELTKVTPNFCRKTTWWYDSARATDELLTDSGDGLTFTSPHTHWIDTLSGAGVFYDPYIAMTHDLSISVTIDGAPAILVDPLYPTDDGDYEVNFETGSITFRSSKAGSTVRATYSYAQSSVWALVPTPGMAIDIESVEAQFSEDASLRDTVVFELWAYNPEDLPNKMLYGQTQYRSMRNFVDEALGSYPVVPAIGGDEGRGLPSAIYGFPFRYGTMRRLSSDTGLELRIRLLRDIEFGGSHCTATFYCTVRELTSL